MKNQVVFDLHHLQILDSNVYIFLYEEDESLESAKWKAYPLREKLVGFNGHRIYQVYIEYQNKVIWVKNRWIYKNIP